MYIKLDKFHCILQIGKVLYILNTSYGEYFVIKWSTAFNRDVSIKPHND